MLWTKFLLLKNYVWELPEIHTYTQNPPWALYWLVEFLPQRFNTVHTFSQKSETRGTLGNPKQVARLRTGLCD